MNSQAPSNGKTIFYETQGKYSLNEGTITLRLISLRITSPDADPQTRAALARQNRIYAQALRNMPETVGRLDWADGDHFTLSIDRTSISPAQSFNMARKN